MSGRYLNAAVAATDSTEARELAARGIEYVDQVMERTPEVLPIMYQRKARLYVAGNMKKPDADAIAAYEAMLAMLDQNAENMNPANPDNALKLYSEAYAFEMAYANATGNKEASKEFAEKYAAVQELLNPKAEE